MARPGAHSVVSGTPARLSSLSSLPLAAGSMRKRVVTAPVSAVSSLRTSALACSQLNSRPCRRRDLHSEDLILGAEPLIDGLPQPLDAFAGDGGNEHGTLLPAGHGVPDFRRAQPRKAGPPCSTPPTAAGRRHRRRCRDPPEPPPRRASALRSRGWLMSRTCKMRSASITSSRVARNAATSRCRQIGDEADGIGQDRSAAARKPHLAHGRIERLEHLVLGRDSSARQAVEQSRLAGIGVADDGHHRKRHALAAGAMQTARLDDHGQLLADRRNALIDQAAVGFDLRFARAAEEAVAAALAFKMGPGPHQPALLVGQMGKLHLQTAFSRQCALPEDFENEARAIEDLAPPCLFEVALLHGRHDVIDDREAGLLGGDQLAELGDLARAEQRRRPRRGQRHDLGRCNIELDGARQSHRFCQAILDGMHGSRAGRSVAVGCSTLPGAGSYAPARARRPAWVARSRSTGARRLRAGSELDGLEEMAIPAGLRPDQRP